MGDVVIKSLQYGNILLEFELVRSKRRTLAIVVEPSERITVRAPAKLSADKILEMVGQKAGWITSKLLFLQELKQEKMQRESANGKSLLYLGNYYRLQVETTEKIKKDRVRLEEDRLVVSAKENTPARVEQALKVWYYERAQEHIEQRVAYFQKLFREKPALVKVKEQRKRWGSCTSDNKLLFNWRCVMATEQAIDYVVVHELCHMPHKNHSRNFWVAVASILPEYRLQKIWLKENGIHMDL